MTSHERLSQHQRTEIRSRFPAGLFYADDLGYLRCPVCARDRYLETGDTQYRHDVGGCTERCDFCGTHDPHATDPDDLADDDRDAIPF